MFTVNFNTPVPIYRQIVDNLKSMLESRTINSGDPIPAIRNLAAQLDIAPNTVARAYRELEAEGIIESGGRRGTYIRRDYRTVSQDSVMDFRVLIQRLLAQGARRSEIEASFREAVKSVFE